MRPLLLVFENPDPSAIVPDIHIIFKNGDGQSMPFVTLVLWFPVTLVACIVQTR